MRLRVPWWLKLGRTCQWRVVERREGGVLFLNGGGMKRLCKDCLQSFKSSAARYKKSKILQLVYTRKEFSVLLSCVAASMQT